MWTCEHHGTATRQWRIAFIDHACGAAAGGFWCARCQRVYDAKEVCVDPIVGGIKRVHICGYPVKPNVCGCNVAYVRETDAPGVFPFGWANRPHPIRWTKLQMLLIQRRTRRLQHAYA